MGLRCGPRVAGRALRGLATATSECARHTPGFSLHDSADSPRVCDRKRGPVAGFAGCVARNARNPRVCTRNDRLESAYPQVGEPMHGSSCCGCCTHLPLSATGTLPTQHTPPELARTRKATPGVLRVRWNSMRKGLCPRSATAS